MSLEKTSLWNKTKTDSKIVQICHNGKWMDDAIFANIWTLPQFFRIMLTWISLGVFIEGWLFPFNKHTQDLLIYDLLN